MIIIDAYCIYVYTHKIIEGLVKIWHFMGKFAREFDFGCVEKVQRLDKFQFGSNDE